MQRIVNELGGNTRGSECQAHYHEGFETAIYLIEGQVKTLYGEDLKKSVIKRLRDFIFIPAGLPHQARNMNKINPAVAIVSRNDCNEQESIQEYFPQTR